MTDETHILAAAGRNRSGRAEQSLRHEHLRLELRRYSEQTVPAVGIDAYAEAVYRANQAAGL